MYCPKCERKRRVGERLKRLKGRKVWIIFCLICGTEITLEDEEESN